MTLDEAPDVLTVIEVARVLRIGRNRAYELVNDGSLFGCRVGHGIRVPKDALKRFLAGAPIAGSATSAATDPTERA
jgi:excisionase family DNA binding protein